MPSIGLVMIVKDEELNLAACLESAKYYVDEIIIVDTGSNDATKKIAERYTSFVYDYKWNDNFSAARNYGIEKTSCDWILSLDADERLECNCKLKSIIEHYQDSDAFMLPLYCFDDKSCQHYERVNVLRLFRKDKGIFLGSIHEQVAIQDSSKIQFLEQPIIYHLAAGKKERNAKRHRNIKLLKKIVLNEPENYYAKYYLAVEWFAFNKIGLAKEYFEQVLSKLDDNIVFFVPALKYYIACLSAQKKFKEALALCIEYTSKFSDYSDLYYCGGLILEELQEFEVAIKWFYQAIKAGTPPLVYAHTYGTESFLSYYHLGCCYESMGNCNKAKAYYEQALTVNPDFVIAIYPLFIRLLFDNGPETAYRYFYKNEHFLRQKNADVIAELFFQAYLTDYACRIVGIKEQNNLVYCSNDLKYLYINGHNEQAKRILRQDNNLSKDEKVVYQIIILLVQKMYSEAHKKALLLWQSINNRTKALAFINLSSFLAEKTINVCIEANRMDEYNKILLSILNDFLHGNYQSIDIRKSISDLIIQSADGKRIIAENYKIKGEALDKVLECQFAYARSLFS